MPPAGYELATPASHRTQTLALVLSTTGIGRFDPWTFQFVASLYTEYVVTAHPITLTFTNQR